MMQVVGSEIAPLRWAGSASTGAACLTSLHLLLDHHADPVRSLASIITAILGAGLNRISAFVPALQRLG